MFFRRKTADVPSAQERLRMLRDLGFEAAPLPGGVVRVARAGCAIDLEETEGALRARARAGALIGTEIAALVDGGYQKFFRTPSGSRKPATAGELKALHDFEEDLKEGLGEKSLYNESLGTVSEFYQYDRLKDRDRGAPKRAWE